MNTDWSPRVGPKEVPIALTWVAAVEALRHTSQCGRMGHACILTSADLLEVYAIGYNGPPQGMPNECERPDQPGNCGCIHAEANAVAKAGNPREPKIAFISGHPCEACAKLLMQTNVQLVIYPGPAHRAYDGPAYLDRRGIVHGTMNQPWVLGMLDQLAGRTGLSRIYPVEFREYGIPRDYYETVIKDRTGADGHA
jgi:deoxycytidylate deaminase